MRRSSLLATTLILALGCDKARELAGDSKGAQAAEPPVSQRLDLSSRPDILFQIYGERDDPRMIPVGVLRNGTIGPIVLASDGWRQFDSIYGKVGSSYTLYENGRSVGTARVRQGMWEAGKEPLYTLPSCELLIPQAAMTLSAGVSRGYTVSHLASSRALRESPPATMSAAEAAPIAKGVANQVAGGAGISISELDALDFRAVAVNTRAGTGPTVIGTYVDRRAVEQSSAGERTAHVFVVADRIAGATAYQATFEHTLNGDASSGEFRRYVDHLDLTGDGVSEIVLEGWEYGGDTFLQFLQYKSGAWVEIYRGRTSWCLDASAR